jgi:hypothetical protein
MTDHCGLKYFLDQPKLNARHAQSMALINEFDLEIKHTKGNITKWLTRLAEAFNKYT